MEKRQKYELLKKELEPYKKALSQAANAIVSNGVSNYPIFVIHKQDINVGIQIVDRKNVEKNWSVNASTLEEFVEKNLIDEFKLEGFKSVFEEHKDELCLFVLSELGASFIFIPK